MKVYPLEKYRFATTQNKVIAISTYEGKTVKGVAKCNPLDNYDLQKGKELAAARCGQKIANRRVARAKREQAKAAVVYDAACRRLEKMDDYLFDAKTAKRASEATLNQLLSKM